MWEYSLNTTSDLHWEISVRHSFNLISLQCVRFMNNVSTSFFSPFLHNERRTQNSKIRKDSFYVFFFFSSLFFTSLARRINLSLIWYSRYLLWHLPSSFLLCIYEGGPKSELNSNVERVYVLVTDNSARYRECTNICTNMPNGDILCGLDCGL